MTKKPHAICLLSGGLDSSTLLYQLKAEGFKVTSLTVDYGQRHAVELSSAVQISKAAEVDNVLVQLGPELEPVFAGAASSQVGAREAVPHGHYAAENMKTTIVPNRNMLLLALAGALAEARSATHIAYAAHAGDHAIYPDCRPEFYESCAQTIFMATDGRVSLYAPFGRMTKTDIARRAAELAVPVALTWSCYDPQGRISSFPTQHDHPGWQHCGLCGTCVERKEAFRDAKLDDPTAYSA